MLNCNIFLLHSRSLHATGWSCVQLVNAAINKYGPRLQLPLGIVRVGTIESYAHAVAIIWGSIWLSYGQLL